MKISIQFSRDQSELTTQIWVALLGVDKQYHEFSQTVLQHSTVCTQASVTSDRGNIWLNLLSIYIYYDTVHYLAFNNDA
jgi:hypothetical protein